MMRKMNFLCSVLAIAFTIPALAAVTAEEAKQLGTNLTIFGAEKAGNKEGTIPPYTGKALKLPSDYDPKNPGRRPDPYANEKPLYSITSENADKYADKLNGLREIFKIYPNYRMDIYPSHRDWAYPKFVLDNTVKNASSCVGVQDELKLEGCWGGFPFPIPKTGKQVMWNHLLQYLSLSSEGQATVFLVPPDGKAITVSGVKVFQQYDGFFNPKATAPNPSDAIYWKIITPITAPARDVGGSFLAHDSLDMAGIGRRAWQYIPGQRRVKLAPNLNYDTPNPTSGGFLAVDDTKLFAGAMDRFDFKLVGKREKFIMYNNFNLTDPKVCPDAKVVNHPRFPNPECVRWELHRVWEVEATLKPGFRHIYHKRKFFFDEDAPGVGSSETYDAAGKLYRVLNMINYPFYENELGGEATYAFALDLYSGNWVSQGNTNERGGGIWTAPVREDRFYSPEALAGQGLR